MLFVTIITKATIISFASFLGGVSALPSPSVWTFHIDEAPAPSPQDGPPLSISAHRDKSSLPYELGGIFGSYLLVLLVVGLALLTAGRRLRQAMQTSPATRGGGMLQTIMQPVGLSRRPGIDPWDSSPISPREKQSQWPSPLKGLRGGSWGLKKSKPVDSVHSSVLTFDETIIEEHKNQNEFEMDRLYAAVAEYEDQKELDIDIKNAPLSPLAQNPPELQHLRFDPMAMPPLPTVPATGKEVSIPSRTATISPKVDIPSVLRTNTAGSEHSRNARPAPLALQSHHSRASSRTSVGSFSRKRSIRTLPISPPMGSPDLAADHLQQYGESEPLSPRHYTPGPPPTPPILSHTASSDWQPQMHVDALSPVSNHFSPAIRSSRQSFHPRSPRRAPSTGSTGPRLSDATIPSHTPTTAAFPLHPTITIAAPPVPSAWSRSRNRALAPLSLASGNASLVSLPIRTAPLPLRAAHPNRDSTIKATTLEHRTNTLRAPGTGIPSTPYSPYMPFTPLTPMTPSRLVTREERKKRAKEEGKRVATIDDLVPEEDDMWGEVS